MTQWVHHRFSMSLMAQAIEDVYDLPVRKYRIGSSKVEAAFLDAQNSRGLHKSGYVIGDSMTSTRNTREEPFAVLDVDAYQSEVYRVLSPQSTSDPACTVWT